MVDSTDDSIHSNTSVTINGGTFEISSGDDGIHADETVSITSGTIQISESYEGIEALNLTISGGDINLTASDDGLNAAGGKDESGISGGRDAMFGGKMNSSFSSGGSIVISGGTLYINASGDGIDANGTLSITDGTITVSVPNFGDTSILDYDSTGTIDGGTFIGTGSSSMTQNFSSGSAQGVIMAVIDPQSEGTSVTLTDSSKTVILSTTSDQDFSCVILSQAAIKEGETYTLTAGSFSTTITMDSTVYSSGGTGGMGGMGGRPGMGSKPRTGNMPDMESMPDMEDFPDMENRPDMKGRPGTEDRSDI